VGDHDMIESGCSNRRYPVVDGTVQTESRSPEHADANAIGPPPNVWVVTDHEDGCGADRLDHAVGEPASQASPIGRGQHGGETLLCFGERLHGHEHCDIHSVSVGSVRQVRRTTVGRSTRRSVDAWRMGLEMDTRTTPEGTPAITVGVIGAGSWGTTVAAMTSANTTTQLWARRDDLAVEINESHTNSRYLPDFILPAELAATSSLEAIVSSSDVIVMAVPSHGYREVARAAAAYLRPWVPIVSLSKGLERESQQRMSEVTEEEMSGHPVAVLTGPNLAKEIMHGQPAASVVAIDDSRIAGELQRLFSTPSLRVYTNPDVIGCEVAGVVKNVIAIASGMAQGMGFGDNTRATLITRGLAEMTRLGLELGGDPGTFAGLAGMGDLIATCASTQSRNNTVGCRLGAGETVDEIVESMNMVAEGVKSSPSVLELARVAGVEMPITEQVVAVCHEGRSARDALAALMDRDAKSELR